MTPIHTEADFDQLSWHDCHIWGVRLEAGDADEDDWTSDLVLDIDFIVEWICGTDRRAQFRVAPANFTFHGVTDLEINIKWESTGFRAALHPASIHQIDRELLHDQKVFLDRPYYKWGIHLNWPEHGEIAFGAVGFSMTLLAEPVISGQQHFSRLERRRLMGGGATR